MGGLVSARKRNDRGNILMSKQQHRAGSTTFMSVKEYSSRLQAELLPVIMAGEPQDKENFYRGDRTTQAKLREPWETDPVVTTLHDCMVYKGNTATMEVEYEVNPERTVNIRWLKNNYDQVQGGGFQSSGRTGMKIPAAGPQHSNNKYTVVVTDSYGRQVSTSGKLYVHT